MSRERALRRAERERVAAEAAVARAVEAERVARRAARRQRLTGWLPQGRNRQTGRLADRRRGEIRATIALLVAFNVLVWIFDASWAARAFALVLSLLAAPVLHVMLFRRSH